ncbi:hypothetical protein KEM48_002766 [Puccinia striiformis f. sp. tritici PST-130]|nr:hypothetical protein KEM48_002766 [Puccinia striiformis f. sp. tritici PST-130]
MKNSYVKVCVKMQRENDQLQVCSQLDCNQRLLGWPSYNRKRPFIRACRLSSRSAGDCGSLNSRSQQEVTGLIAHKAIDTGSSSQSLFQAHKRKEPQVETQDLTIMKTTSGLLENSIPQPQRKVTALFHAFILLEEEEPNSIKIDRNRNSVIILAENIGHTTHPLSDSSEMKIEDG